MARSCPRCGSSHMWGCYGLKGRTDNGYVRGDYYGSYSKEEAVHTCGKCLEEMKNNPEEKEFIISNEKAKTMKRIWVFNKFGDYD